MSAVEEDIDNEHDHEEGDDVDGDDAEHEHHDEEGEEAEEEQQQHHKQPPNKAPASQQQQQQQQQQSTSVVVTQPKLTADGKHLLHSGFSFWYIKRKGSSNEAYDQNIKKLATFQTVEDFWHYYSHIVRPNDLPASVDYHCFREGITPLWEDEANKNGGKWVIRLKKGMASRCWEDSLLAMIGDVFRMGDQICGVVISTKASEDTLSFWNKTASYKGITNKIRDVIRDVLGIDSEAAFEYRPHAPLLSHAQSHHQPSGSGAGSGSYPQIIPSASSSSGGGPLSARGAQSVAGGPLSSKGAGFGGGGGGGAGSGLGSGGEEKKEVDEEGFEQPKQRKQRQRRKDE